MRRTLPYGTSHLPIRGDEDGSLIAIEEQVNVPFQLRRVFTIFQSKPGVVRGDHANRNSSFGFVCVAGTCRVRLLGKNREVMHDACLDSAEKLFWIGPMVWKEMYELSEDCVLIVLSDHLYDPDEYIYDFSVYEDYLEEK